MTWSIRRLSADDADTYADLRLEALKTAPDAFAADHDETAAEPRAYWVAQFEPEGAFFGAFAGDELVGSANFAREKGRKMEHIGLLLGMYVRPRMRGTGCAMDIVKTVIAHARGKVMQIHLGVGSHNDRAIRLYEKAGFSVYGTAPRYLKVGERFVDEHLMVKFLDKEDEQ